MWKDNFLSREKMSAKANNWGMSLACSRAADKPIFRSRVSEQSKEIGPK